jgi:hypothetical protein
MAVEPLAAMAQMRETFVQHFLVRTRSAHYMEKPYRMWIIDLYATTAEGEPSAMAYFDEVAAFDEIDFYWLRVVQPASWHPQLPQAALNFLCSAPLISLNSVGVFRIG